MPASDEMHQQRPRESHALTSLRQHLLKMLNPRHKKLKRELRDSKLALEESERKVRDLKLAIEEAERDAEESRRETAQLRRDLEEMIEAHEETGAEIDEMRRQPTEAIRRRDLEKDLPHTQPTTHSNNNMSDPGALGMRATAPNEAELHQQAPGPEAQPNVAQIQQDVTETERRLWKVQCEREKQHGVDQTILHGKELLQHMQRVQGKTAEQLEDMQCVATMLHDLEECDREVQMKKRECARLERVVDKAPRNVQTANDEVLEFVHTGVEAEDEAGELAM